MPEACHRVRQLPSEYNSGRLLRHGWRSDFFSCHDSAISTIKCRLSVKRCPVSVSSLNIFDVNYFALIYSGLICTYFTKTFLMLFPAKRSLTPMHDMKKNQSAIRDEARPISSLHQYLIFQALCRQSFHRSFLH